MRQKKAITAEVQNRESEQFAEKGKLTPLRPAVQFSGLIPTAPIYEEATLLRVDKRGVNYFIGEKPSTNGFVKIPLDATDITCYFKASGRKEVNFGYDGARIPAPKKKTLQDYQRELAYQNRRLSG